MRTIEWDYPKNQLKMIDQRLLPGELVVVSMTDYRQVVTAIKDMVVRGAPAIGAAAAFGLALAALRSAETTSEGLRADLNKAMQDLQAARPTAVNLAWALRRVMTKAGEFHEDIYALKQTILQEAQTIADEDVQVNKQMAEFGAELIDDGDTVIHHCNTGALATVDWGTALGVIRTAFEQGKRVHVLVDETRPRLQGARLTAWELEQYGIPYEIITDNAAGYFISSGKVNKVLFGGDRMAANGDVANKIGTYMLALAAYQHNIPVYTVVPTSTVDLSIAHGGLIPIEERPEEEVLNLEIEGKSIFPEGARARNPAFDVTPYRFLTAIVTEKGIVYPPFDINLTQVCIQKL
ncbi:MAG: S-methyl-5-thioribose-1-phosphate isomerase [Anaerolineales bacterium]|nr:S-methyl-5-thioribose-1-phosphate isomerase [Anaerolineales bacterium]